MLPRLHVVEAELESVPDPVSFAEYRDDPVGFAIDHCGISPWSQQADVMVEVAKSNRVAVRSGQKTGKSLSAAILALWWVATRPRGRVVCLATTHHQLKNVLWRELRRMYRRKPEGSRVSVGMKLGGPRTPPKDPMTGLDLDEQNDALGGDDETEGRQIYGLSTTEQERLAGISGAELLFILDEGSGIPDELFEVIIGNSAGEAKIVTYSNPTKTSGWYFRIFHERWADWSRMRIATTDNPNVRAGRKVVPGLATRPWLEELQRMCGADYERHPLYRVRALGQFPLQSSEAVVSLELMEAARQRWDEMHDAKLGVHMGEIQHRDQRLVVGVDVARFGDDSSVAQARRGTHVYRPKTWGGLDGPQLAGQVLEYLEAVRTPGEGIASGTLKPLVNIDVIGVGASVYDALRREDSIVAQPINVATKSDNPRLWPTLRDQLWQAVNGWLDDGGTLPPDLRLEADLLSPHYEIDARGRMVVEAKKKTKKRLDGRSPDHGDAFVLSLYEGERAVRGPLTLPALAG